MRNGKPRSTFRHWHEIRMNRDLYRRLIRERKRAKARKRYRGAPREICRGNNVIVYIEGVPGAVFTRIGVFPVSSLPWNRNCRPKRRVK